MNRKARKKAAMDKIDSIDRMVSSSADVYGVNRSLPYWTIAPVVKETVRYVMLLKEAIDLNQSQTEDLTEAVIKALYPRAVRGNDWDGEWIPEIQTSTFSPVYLLDELKLKKRLKIRDLVPTPFNIHNYDDRKRKTKRKAK